MAIWQSLTIIVLLINFQGAEQAEFVYNGFEAIDLKLSGMADVKSGVLRLTDDTARMMGHAFYPKPIKNLHNSFSTTFVFSIMPQYPDLGGHGLAFVLTPFPELKGALPSQYMGMLNSSSNGKAFNHLFAIEFDTVQDYEFNDINDNHVGIDLNNMISNASAAVSYKNGKLANESQALSLKSGENLRAWIDYDGVNHRLNVSLAPARFAKPLWPVLSSAVNLSNITVQDMYVGFSAATGLLSSFHHVMGWSFSTNGSAKDLNVKNLPSIRSHGGKKMLHRIIAIVVSAAVLLGATIVFVVIYWREREHIEAWELECGPHRFTYKEIKLATKGFKEVLGFGGFGRVYKGVLPTGVEVAVKRVSHDSKQGVREFVAEISSIGRLRHRNLVQLQGWCRRKGELLLVYDYMPNGSLDKSLFENSKGVLNWSQRYRILKGVAAGLVYLHEEWEQRVVHRDVKASNVLLDAELDGRLGDFGLARLYEHGKNPQTTKVVGTLGYLAPELTRTGKATTNSDVYSYGALLLEVACGRRPVEPNRCAEELVLVEWVWGFEENGIILEAADRRLRGEYVVKEMETVLKLGLLCSHPNPDCRPNMRQVLQILSDDAPLPPMPSRPAFEGDTPPFTALFCSRVSSGSGPQNTDSPSTVATDRGHDQELAVFRSV